MINLRTKKILLWLVPPAVLLLLLLVRENLAFFFRVFPPCLFHKLTGGLCPGCGNTRSVGALLHMDVFTSLQMNITPLLLGVLLALLYLETLLSAYGKKIRLLPRKSVFWIVLIGLVLAYYILRNFIA